MRSIRILAAGVATAIAAITFHTAGAGGQSAGPYSAENPPPFRQFQTPAGRDYSLKPCEAKVNVYDVGDSFDGIDCNDVLRACSDPEQVRSRRAGGNIDPDSMQRAYHFRSAIYGTCKAESDSGGCAPPLEVQVWPACERSAADYTFGEPETATRMQPSEVLEVRGVPARFYGENRLEVSAGDMTIVLFGDSRERLLTAAQQLQTRPGSPNPVGPEDALPDPVEGAQEGTLAC